jgi:hypothetical protein
MTFMKTGYEISFKDFNALCTDHRNDVAPLLRDWFGYEVVTTSKDFLLLDLQGVDVNPQIVHETIQADPERQGRIYRLAMTLWR